MRELVKILIDGGVAVAPTDTLYGILGRANSKAVVKRVFDLKSRPSDKPFIILISEIDQLRQFGVDLSPELVEKLHEFWPGPNSVILTVEGEEFKYLHCGLKSLAFRLPDNDGLRALISETGPLIAPSANPGGEPPSLNIAEAKNYFSHKVDFYQDAGQLESKPSQLWRHISGLSFDKIARG